MKLSLSVITISLLVLNLTSCATSNVAQSKKDRNIATVQMASECYVANLSAQVVRRETKLIDLRVLSVEENTSICKELQGAQISSNSCMDYSTGESDFALIPSYKVKVFSYASGSNNSNSLKIHIIKNSNSQIVAQSLGSSEVLNLYNGDPVNDSVSVTFNSLDHSPVQYQVVCAAPQNY